MTGLEEARGLATAAVKSAVGQQKRLWKFLEIDVHAANSEVNGREHQLIWAKIEELANANAYPLWMDAVLITLTSMVPVNAILVGFAAKLARSRKLMALPGLPTAKRSETVYLQDAKQLKAIMRARKAPVDIKKQSKAWLEIGEILQPELVAGLRTLIRLGGQAKVAPHYKRDVVVGAIKAQQAGGTSLPSTSVFKGMLQWIEVSRSSDERILELLEERIALSQDDEWLRSVPKYLETDERRSSRTSKSLDEGPTEVFQRFVEACLWCTTYDFTPSFKPAHPGRAVTTRGDRYNIGAKSPSAELFPFPKPFWDNLVSRHYDPFVQGGNKTYAEIGQMSYVAPASSYNPPSSTAATLLETGMAFDPMTRLSMHWSGILAPSLLNANKELTAAIADYLGPV